MIILDDRLHIFYSTLVNNERYLSGFSTKALGDGRDPHVILNYFGYQKISYRKIVILDQVHSTNVHFFDGEKKEPFNTIENTDGVITNSEKVMLVVKTADCLPLLFVDKRRGLIGASHQGWQGSLKKMAVKMISAFVKKGSHAQDISVAFGPAIGVCCYDIDDNRAHQFLTEFDGYADKIFHVEKGKRHLNLARLNYLQLLEVCVKKENMDFFPFCTKCDDRHFFSFRRDGKNNYSEMFSFIMKTTYT